MGFLKRIRNTNKDSIYSISQAGQNAVDLRRIKDKPKHFALNALPPRTKEAIQISNISLWLDSYEDVFSDFDPRPYSQRALSDDFISEAKKVAKENASGVAELKLLIPAEKRNTSHEPILKKRLRDYFKAHYNMVYQELGKIIREGAFFVLIGFFLMITASYILFKVPEKGFFSSILITLFEPASWFLFWEGLQLLIFERNTKKPDLNFYRKMSKCDIRFYEY